MRKINIANIISFIVIVMVSLLMPLCEDQRLGTLLLIASAITNFILFIIANVKRYKGIKNELKEDKLYNIVAIVNTVVLIVLSILISDIPYEFEGWDGLVLVVIIAILISLLIVNSITFIISQKFCIKLYLNMENVDEKIKKSKKKQNTIINIILTIIITCFIIGFLINTVSAKSVKMN